MDTRWVYLVMNKVFIQTQVRRGRRYSPENELRFALDIPPPYEEVIKSKSNTDSAVNASHYSSSTPIHSISLLVAQADSHAAARPT